MTNLTNKEIEELASRIAKETVHEMFKVLLETDMEDVKEVKELRTDLIHLRSFRIGTERARMSIIAAFFSTVVPGMLYLLWDAIKN